MAAIIADRVRDTSTTTGTGAVAVSGTAPTGYRTFSAVCSTSDTLRILIHNQGTPAEWEVSNATYSSANTLTRTTIEASSNANAAVSFSAGTKDVVHIESAVQINDQASLSETNQVLSGGADVTSSNQGTKSSGTFTVDSGICPLQYITNNGAFTLAAPANDGSLIVLVTNGASAGAITFSGFSVGSSTGDALTTTNTQKFSIHIWRINGVSGYRIAAHQ